MNFNDKLEQYILEHTQPEENILKELFRETHLKIYHPRMLSGHLQGKILAMLCRMIKPVNILEIGTYTGYSAISMAFAIDNNSKIYTIDNNDEIEDFTRTYFKKAGVENKIEFLIGDAIAMGYDTLITAGAEQSNHCRQTAAAAAACGLKCHLVLGGKAPDIPGGNLLLNNLFKRW